MSIEEKISVIQKERYGNYQGRLMKNLGVLHNFIRYAEKPLTFFQFIKQLFGFKVTRERVMTDEQFLSFLEEQERINPKPVYKIPDHLKTNLIG